jgi:hypothetical protein
MTCLWVKFKPFSAVKVSTEIANDVADLIKNIKTEIPLSDDVVATLQAEGLI